MNIYIECLLKSVAVIAMCSKYVANHAEMFKLLYYVVLDAIICSQEWYQRVNANTLIGATILFLGHIIMGYTTF